MNKANGPKTGELQYTPPSISELLSLLLKKRRPTGPFNEVWPRVYIGDAHTAQDKALLRSLGVTHVVNSADGPAHIDTGPGFYMDTCIQYHGVEAPDSKDFDLSPYFYPTADFIHSGLSQGGKVFVHCARGISRSAALVLAYLMIQERLSLAEAAKVVRKHRNILPNAGFLSQLCYLDMTLTLERSTEK
ncbi:dual specificity protein phosphatase 13-like [Alosa sapidissima]|uniref:dual specificity protein phosphatase 13-like n=1 Tax=Alosa sapidissima TaxID=34773 RepID=UPI001C096CDC|nr:dual specificity protein phosphatase 13-like [Alosa sapidissima]